MALASYNFPPSPEYRQDTDSVSIDLRHSDIAVRFRTYKSHALLAFYAQADTLDTQGPLPEAGVAVLEYRLIELLERHGGVLDKEGAYGEMESEYTGLTPDMYDQAWARFVGSLFSDVQISEW